MLSLGVGTLLLIEPLDDLLDHYGWLKRGLICVVTAARKFAVKGTYRGKFSLKRTNRQLQEGVTLIQESNSVNAKYGPTNQNFGAELKTMFINNLNSRLWKQTLEVT